MAVKTVGGIVAGLLIGSLLAVFLTREDSDGDSGLIPERFIPTMSLAPTDVVARQLDALQMFGVEDDACKWCYQFAAPSNRVAVGSPERFETLMRQNPYSSLLGHKENLLGKAMIVGDDATVLCSILDANGLPAVFRFVLLRQHKAPFKHCWMTTAVYRMDNYPAGDWPSIDVSPPPEPATSATEA